jgi:hypothetical protein
MLKKTALPKRAGAGVGVADRPLGGAKASLSMSTLLDPDQFLLPCASPRTRANHHHQEFTA